MRRHRDWGERTTWLSPIQGRRRTEQLLGSSPASATFPATLSEFTDHVVPLLPLRRAPPKEQNVAVHVEMGGAGDDRFHTDFAFSIKRCNVSSCCNSNPTATDRYWQPGMCAVWAGVRLHLYHRPEHDMKAHIATAVPSARPERAMEDGAKRLGRRRSRPSLQLPSPAWPWRCAMGLLIL